MAAVNPILNFGETAKNNLQGVFVYENFY